MRRIVVLSLLASALAMSPARAQNKNPVVVIDTSLGKIKVELHEKDAPITVRNFLTYVDDEFYDGTIFHVVIADFMVQAGGLEPGLKDKKTGVPIKNEADNGLSNRRCTMARH